MVEGLCGGRSKFEPRGRSHGFPEDLRQENFEKCTKVIESYFEMFIPSITLKKFIDAKMSSGFLALAFFYCPESKCCNTKTTMW